MGGFFSFVLSSFLSTFFSSVLPSFFSWLSEGMARVKQRTRDHGTARVMSRAPWCESDFFYQVSCHTNIKLPEPFLQLFLVSDEELSIFLRIRDVNKHAHQFVTVDLSFV